MDDNLNSCVEYEEILINNIPVCDETKKQFLDEFRRGLEMGSTLIRAKGEVEACLQ